MTYDENRIKHLRNLSLIGIAMSLLAMFASEVGSPVWHINYAPLGPLMILVGIFFNSIKE